ncbi:MAG TPA: hypothetical protein VFP84_20585 [Kofleriaceae bacterium]|nr:hypothetical protein [Kofleriaceae bacterium]
MLSCAAALAACTTGPLTGTVITDSAVNKSFLFEGYTDHPSEQVLLEVLKTPTSDPGNDANWVQFGSTTTAPASSPSVISGDTASPLYFWSTNAVPVPTGQGARWPSGGVVRLRARRLDASKGNASHTLTTFDVATFGTCLGEKLAASAEWTEIGIDCAGTGGTMLAMVSAQKTPLGLPAADKPDWLGAKGDISTAETATYYNTWGAPATLADFKSRYGFPSGEVTATYYNDGDLGLGREMHCRKFSSFFLGGVACYVTNYSGTDNTPVFGADPAVVLPDAIAHQRSFATVAMVYSQLGGNTDFVVYKKDGTQALSAQLDSPGRHTSIPNNCLTCHGIASSYSASSHTVSGAKFLAFDPFAYKYSTQAGFTLADQQEKFRQLNVLVKQTSPTPGISQLIDGLYAPKAVTTAGAIASDGYVPDGWADTTVTKSLYLGVVKPGCRTCHTSSAIASFDFLESDDFSAFSTAIRHLVCDKTAGGTRGHNMPQAERVSKKFWESGARAYLLTAYAPSPPDGLEACDP